MLPQNKRIFIQNLPETATQSEIESIFSNYGKVVSVDIKERNGNTSAQSQFFSYVTLEINDKQLQKCFQYFSNHEWLGQYVELQIAKESFMERLKRERGETDITPVKQETIRVEEGKERPRKVENGAISLEKIKERPKKGENGLISVNECDESSQSERELLDYVIKSNKGKTIPKNGLKIESLGKPVAVIELRKKRPKTDPRNLEAIKKKNAEYNQRKAIIKAALSNVDTKRSNKTIFDDEPKEAHKKSLFNGDSDSESEYNFAVKSQFEGEKGRKLMALQAKFKNDDRFVLDERFVETEPNIDEKTNDELTIEEEKRKEMEILGEVLGYKVKTQSIKPDIGKKMIRYDPNNPEHSKYEGSSKQKRKPENNVAQVAEAPEPIVSNEVFYKVQSDLKEVLEKKEEFSLLGTFGKITKQTNQDEYVENVPQVNITEKNPFKYDSSDEDGNNEDEEIEQLKNVQIEPTESFFFRQDDYRFQEGLDFMKRMATKQYEDFGQVRRDIKRITKAKVKNNQRKNKPFKRKLGGNRKKKMIRVKKALKR